ncbi:MAG: hypothetical protein OXG07_10665 [Anaerolineaceae bacterium]|nr:hypothetical protein [Anaerolineaceae bacterium]
MPERITRVARLRRSEQFREHLARIGADLPLADQLLAAPASPMARPLHSDLGPVGNRWCILPMEGWDGTLDGQPTELTVRRWRRFGLSGAKLIWGGEAVAVRHEGRANPNQLLLNEATLPAIAGLRQTLVEAHRERFGAVDDLCVGLQLTHSGRFCRPDPGRPMQPRTLYRHPLLDAKFGIAPDDDAVLLGDDEIARLIEDFIDAARLAQRAGFAWVDIKHCHGYLGHEFLSAFRRPGRYGGSFENRSRFLREVVAGIRSEAPGLGIGLRLSAFDMPPWKPGADGVGVPDDWPADDDWPRAFGEHGAGMDEAHRLLALLAQLGIQMVCITAGSPYYVPHIQRPALFPPSDGYLPPEDPLLGVARLVQATAQLKAAHPGLRFTGSGYSYLQEWLPQVAQAAVEREMVDVVGLGRMALACPELPADTLAGRPLQRKLLCRTFSDCTTAPRNHLVSGCYPLDDFYRDRPEAKTLATLKQES